MADSTFTKISSTSQPLYGPRKIVLCGFTAAAQAKFIQVMQMADLAATPRMWALPSHADHTMAELFALPADTGSGQSSSLPRAIIVAGIMEKELHALMAICRKTGMKKALWATLTPSSETWTLTALLAELAAERKAMGAK